MRDYIAHGAGDHLLMPGRIPDGQRRGGDCQSALGRYHTHRKAVPSTIEREIHLIGWSPREQVIGGPVGLLYDGQPLGPHEAVEQLRSAIPGRGPIDDWTWVLVRAVPHDDGLMRFDSLFEVTTYPCELLWGPGNAWDAVTWAEQDLPEGNTVGVPDRLFLVQYDHGRLYLPDVLKLMASLPPATRRRQLDTRRSLAAAVRCPSAYVWATSHSVM